LSTKLKGWIEVSAVKRGVDHVAWPSPKS